MLDGRWMMVALSLTAFAGPAWADPPRKVLLLYQGPDGHPPQTHEYEQGMKILHQLLQKVLELETTLVKADEPWKEGPALLAKADGAVLFLSEGAAWLSRDKQRLEAFRDLAKRRGGLVVLHWAMGAKDAASIKAIVVDRLHPLCRGLGPFKVRDEFYYQLKLHGSNAELLPMLQVEIDGKLETVAWAWERP